MNARSHTINAMEFVNRAAQFGFLIALVLLALGALSVTDGPAKSDDRSNLNKAEVETTSLKPQDKDQILVAFLISAGAVVNDCCVPSDVSQDVISSSIRYIPFLLY